MECCLCCILPHARYGWLMVSSWLLLHSPLPSLAIILEHPRGKCLYFSVTASHSLPFIDPWLYLCGHKPSKHIHLNHWLLISLQGLLLGYNHPRRPLKSAHKNLLMMISLHTCVSSHMRWWTTPSPSSLWTGYPSAPKNNILADLLSAEVTTKQGVSFSMQY